MLNTVSVKNSLNGYQQLINGRLDAATETISRHAEIIQKVDGVVEGVQTKEASINTSNVLNDEGKRQAVAELATASAPKFGFLERVVRSLADDLTATKERLFTVKPPSKFGTDAYAYGLEIRQDYKLLNQNERDSRFVTATQAGDDVTVWAMLQAPIPMVTEAIMQSALQERARRDNPETVARLKQVEILHESLSGLRDSLVIWLRSLGGNPETIFKELGGEEPAPSPIEVARRQVQHA